jgi:hypothetical protein
VSADVVILLVVLAVLIGGGCLILVAQWARKRNSSLGGDASAWGGDSRKVSLPHIFFGARSYIETQIGQALAWTVIAVVMCFLAFAAYAIFIAS